mmetsp:Transcript_60168/g.188448  ORF Transcript_60168/g.188448 Transcript_60168/m.188448 type:complete len:285 (-) Transcript_60168:696-1550(-)
MVPLHRIWIARRGTLAGSTITSCRRNCSRTSSPRAATLAQKSSRKACFIFSAMRPRSDFISDRRCAGSSAPSPWAEARARALAPYLDLAPVRKAAWPAESFALCASISASWLASSWAPCVLRLRALCWARRSAGVALASLSSAPLFALCCSAARACKAVVQERSCCSAGRTASAPTATRRTRRASTSRCSPVAASSASKQAGSMGTHSPSTVSSAGCSGPRNSSACSWASARMSVVETPGSPTLRTSRPPVAAALTVTTLPCSEAKPSCICPRASPIAAGVLAK